MNINAIIEIVKKIPKDKWNDEKTIKKAIKAAGKVHGKTFSEAELNKYVQQFRSFSKGGGSLSLLSMLLKSGVNMEQINDIKKKMRS
ncbi:MULTISPECIES: hypothetical protein [Aneurinibacillus]|uniref:Uncharacterized protein n=1 Tax=Aneurinibacillus thermoaerophilus TaxID=143495 RepID=A0A1G8FGJ0_ANETH|nr:MULTISPECIES: hypothetical protein [Aneurinibacillus]AMA71812.1 hypothetical protein ACH33_02470 [Aneurinibacillus sp. XH2]MED0677237.1 hypothetical protein [Aneurinibacillus thermoaerophilus]MED0680517.1 hypothetical protein [Aneurinibacillus thermoaerophilus]MED0738106.1 hypothetical protein [Aneurinibacillus thermoaerophilus]MED0764843.1 hypothetical protein [Aneurinibacillus thermoaerophilus]